MPENSKRVAVVLASVLGFGSAILGASSSIATPITYTEEATASGSLGGVAFTNVNVVLRMSNNTDNVIRNGSIFSNIGTATVSVGGSVPIDFANPIEVFSDTTSPIGIAGFKDEGAIILANAGIAPGYDLRTSIGPTSGTFGLGHSGPVPTTNGDLILTAVQNFGATFTARTAVGVPEPGTFTILSTGIGLIWVIMMRRRRGGT